VKKLFPNSAFLRQRWASPEGRTEVVEQLAERGIDLDELRRVSQQPEADPFDLLCHLAFSAPVRTRRERANTLRKERREFFQQYSTEAQAILNDLLDKYTDYGVAQFHIPEILKLPPISEKGNVMEIVSLFGGAEQLRDAVNELQNLLYAA